MLEKLERAQEKILYLFTFVGVTFISIFGILNILYDKKVLGVIEIFLTIIGIVNILIYRIKASYYFASRIMILILMLLFWFALVTGGFKNQAIYWIYVLPVLIFFLREKKSALLWNIVFVLGIIVLKLFSFLGLIKIPYSSETIFVALASYAVISFLAYFYSETLTSLLEMLKEKAIYDSLTEVYNRDFVLTYAENEIEKIKSGEEKNIILVFIDLDDFKKINDAYGHDKGDEVLSRISKILKESFRSSDIVGRIGGDEFLVIVHSINKKAIEDKLEQIRAHIEKKFKEFNISISYGIVSIPQETGDLQEALRLADKRMYDMKFRKSNYNKEESKNG